MMYCVAGSVRVLKTSGGIAAIFFACERRIDSATALCAADLSSLLTNGMLVRLTNSMSGNWVSRL